MEILPYKDGRLVINSLLCYVDNKRKSLERDHLSRLIRDHFNGDEIRDGLHLLSGLVGGRRCRSDDALDAIFDILDSQQCSNVWFAALDIGRFPETNTELLLRILDQLTWIKAAVEQCSPSTPDNLVAASVASLSPPSVNIAGKNKRSLETAVAKLKEMRSTTSKNSSPVDDRRSIAQDSALIVPNYASAMMMDCPAASDDQMSAIEEQSPLLTDQGSTNNGNCIQSQTAVVLPLRPELPLSNGQAIYRPLYSTTNFMNSFLFNSQATLKNDEKPEEDVDQMAENAFKPYVCQHRNCNKRFTNKFLLKKHEFIHTGLRPHQCNICFKKFNRKDNLLRHVKTHDKIDETSTSNVAVSAPASVITSSSSFDEPSPSSKKSSNKIAYSPPHHQHHHIRPETGDKLCQLLKQKTSTSGVNAGDFLTPTPTKNNNNHGLRLQSSC